VFSNICSPGSYEIFAVSFRAVWICELCDLLVLIVPAPLDWLVRSVHSYLLEIWKWFALGGPFQCHMYYMLYCLRQMLDDDGWFLYGSLEYNNKTTRVWFLREQKHASDGLWPGFPGQRPSWVCFSSLRNHTSVVLFISYATKTTEKQLLILEFCTPCSPWRYADRATTSCQPVQQYTWRHWGSRRYWRNSGNPYYT
jgi:hypothetical protein